MSFNKFFVYLVTIFLLQYSVICNAKNKNNTIVGVAYKDLFIPLIKTDAGNVVGVSDKELIKEGFIVTDRAGKQEIFPLDTGARKLAVYKLDSDSQFLEPKIFSVNNEEFYFRKMVKEIQLSVVFSYLLKQNWFKHYNKLEHTTKKISASANVGILGVTDLNYDNKEEIWLTYKTMYGQHGFLILELDGNDVEKLSGACFECD